MDEKTEAQGGSHGQLASIQDQNLVLPVLKTKFIVLLRAISKQKEVASDTKTLAAASSKDVPAKIP